MKKTMLTILAGMTAFTLIGCGDSAPSTEKVKAKVMKTADKDLDKYAKVINFEVLSSEKKEKASARICVEHVNAKIKTFQILT